MYCGSNESKVIDKRASKARSEIRRRRECLNCHKRYTTFESIRQQVLYVIKRDGRRENFSRDKLLLGIKKALEKRPSIDKAEDIADKIEGKLTGQGKKEVASKDVGKMVLAELRKVDKVAYLRFASVYRGFSELGDFQKELQGLNGV